MIVIFGAEKLFTSQQWMIWNTEQQRSWRTKLSTCDKSKINSKEIPLIRRLLSDTQTQTQTRRHSCCIDQKHNDKHSIQWNFGMQKYIMLDVNTSYIMRFTFDFRFITILHFVCVRLSASALIAFDWMEIVETFTTDFFYHRKLYDFIC